MKKNIRIVLLGEIILLVALFLFNLILCTGDPVSAIAWYIDLPSLLLILLIQIPGMIIMGEWKDFLKAFSVGIRHYTLLELKNITEAVGAAQKLTVYGALLVILTSGIIVMGRLGDPSTIGPNLAVCFLAGFYAVIAEFLLLPLRLNAERTMNEEMDFEDGEE